jgi:hypothetical protein
MTGPDDPTTTDMTAALVRTLRHHAEEAPSAEGLTERAVAVVSRRRRRRIHASIAAVVVLAVGIPLAVATTIGDGNGTAPTAREAHPTWRWESYRGVQVQVPPDWGYGVLGQAWCAATPDGKPRLVRAGAVGRPGAMYAIKCPSVYPPLGLRENWLTFDRTDRVGVRRFDGGWVEETRRVNGVLVTVFTNDDALRAAVLASAEPIAGTDRHGCATDHSVTADPDGYRPDSATGGLPPAGAVESISVCRYTVAGDSAPPLLSSSRIAGAGAKELVAAIQAAPEGEGPDVGNTGPGSGGSEILVLRADTTDGPHEVVVRYSGQKGNGFDDGTTKHELTADAVRSLLTGTNRPQQMSMPVADLLPD